ncbi:putative HVA22-like protein g [Solanum dulcamara]|uniref:putative HVA22-like protein g n=1 Tax=Solanum dulcamara TaxID=45834 RepID=UPI00248509E7|nr:putative HVA22-like protein g [Solanum dulcamara]
MLGNFITSGLVLILGYAYPAFECFKTIEKNKVEIDELRFWCQYWIIVAALRIFESFGDLFLSWLPMYGEAKLALFIYLWYPKTKGTAYIYDTILKPFVAKYETDIDRSLIEFRAKAWDLAIYYWQNCTEIGQAKFLQMIEYIASQSKRGTYPNSEIKDETNHSGEVPPNTPSGLFKRNNKQPVDKKPTHSSSSPPPSRPPFQDYDSVEDNNFHAGRATLRRSNKGTS